MARRIPAARRVKPRNVGKPAPKKPLLKRIKASEAKRKKPKTYKESKRDRHPPLSRPWPGYKGHPDQTPRQKKKIEAKKKWGSKTGASKKKKPTKRSPVKRKR